MYNLSSQFALSAGLGYIQGKSSGKDTTIRTESTGTATFDNTVSAIPVTLGLYYYVPLFSKSRLSIGGGASYYFTNFDHRHYREDGLGWWLTNDRSGHSGGIGFHGRIGFEYSVSKSVTILVEGLGRYAKIDGFEGTRNQHDSNNWSASTEVAYYFVERDQPGFGWFQRVIASNEEPSGSQYRNVRPAEVNFSGFTIRIGLKIKLF